jgi:hypothetical protein
MSNVYVPMLADRIDADGVGWWMLEGSEVPMGGVTLVRHGSVLREDRDAWHETRSAAMDEAAVRIEVIAARLSKQAAKIRQEAEDIRRKAVVE